MMQQQVIIFMIFYVQVPEQARSVCFGLFWYVHVTYSALRCAHTGTCKFTPLQTHTPTPKPTHTHEITPSTETIPYHHCQNHHQASPCQFQTNLILFHIINHTQLGPNQT